MDWLQTTLNNFKTKYNLSGERFAYTPIKYRVKNKLHSKHFHVKIRIPTEMYLQVFPSIRMLAASRSDVQMKLFELEPLEYAFSRQPTLQWHEVRQQIYDDIDESSLFCLPPLNTLQEAQYVELRKGHSRTFPNCEIFDWQFTATFIE